MKGMGLALAVAAVALPVAAQEEPGATSDELLKVAQPFTECAGFWNAMGDVADGAADRLEAADDLRNAARARDAATMAHELGNGAQVAIAGVLMGGGFEPEAAWELAAVWSESSATWRARMNAEDMETDGRITAMGAHAKWCKVQQMGLYAYARAV